jgi:hypothetical protein
VGDGTAQAVLVGYGTGQAASVGTGTAQAVLVGDGTGQAASVGVGTGQATAVAHAVGTAVGLALAVGVLSAETVGTGTGVALPQGAGSPAFLLGLGTGVAPVPAADAVLELAESAAAVLLCSPDVAAAEALAVPGPHPPHSRAMPTAPPTVRTARRAVARGRFCV